MATFLENEPHGTPEGEKDQPQVCLSPTRYLQDQLQPSMHSQSRIHIPSGAGPIVREIVAKRILELLLTTETEVDSEVFPKAIANQLVHLATEYPVIFQHKYQTSEAEDPRFPLSTVCFLRAPLTVVESIYLAYPEAARSSARDPQRKLPFRAACFAGAPLDVIQFLYQLEPSVASCCPPPYGLCAIHLFFHGYGFRRSSNFQFHLLDFLLRVHTDGPRKVCSWKGDSALSYAVLNGAPVEAIQKVYRAFPEAIESTNHKGYRILDSLARSIENRNNPNIQDVFKFLIKITPPESMFRPSQGGTRLSPIRQVARVHSRSTIQYLVNHFGPATATRLRDSTTLLHDAAFANTPDVVSFLLTIRSMVRAPMNNTPLHAACDGAKQIGEGSPRSNQGETLEVIQLLVDHTPDLLLLRRGGSGPNRPLDLAIYLDLSFQIVEFLHKQTTIQEEIAKERWKRAVKRQRLD